MLFYMKYILMVRQMIGSAFSRGYKKLYCVNKEYYLHSTHVPLIDKLLVVTLASVILLYLE